MSKLSEHDKCTVPPHLSDFYNPFHRSYGSEGNMRENCVWPHYPGRHTWLYRARVCTACLGTIHCPCSHYRSTSKSRATSIHANHVYLWIPLYRMRSTLGKYILRQLLTRPSTSPQRFGPRRTTKRLNSDDRKFALVCVCGHLDLIVPYGMGSVMPSP